MSLRLLLAALAMSSAAGCATNVDIFTDGRLENRCTGAIPACGRQAGCVLTGDEYFRGEFPGGQRLIVRTDTDEANFRTRVLLVDGTFPGTQILIRAFDVGCGGFDEGRGEDRNLFDFAGDDGIIDFNLEVTGRGDHLVEVFSDMAATFYLTVDVREDGQ
ncbi:MAG TPA: hypothetical protein RMF84_04815 [Polyangiaceae bacterium LLY-WYZ-14_1]|jgi:hypothetical protein|nr:hypothetical protein [Polyangiaceae bacterium LLY-WYZ-14_1]